MYTFILFFSRYFDVMYALVLIVLSIIVVYVAVRLLRIRYLLSSGSAAKVGICHVIIYFANQKYPEFSVPARLGKGQGAKEIGHNLAREKPKFGHNLVCKRHKIGHSLERE